MTAAATDTKHSRERLAALVAAVEASEDGVNVTDTRGRVLYENGALRRLLTTESERRALEDAFADVRRSTAARAGTGDPGTPVRPDASAAREASDAPRIPAGDPRSPTVTLHVRTTASEYRVRGTAMHHEGASQYEIVIVVWVRRCRPRQLAPEALRERYGLTRQELRVAALIGAGLGGREIAHALGVSPHTARRHAEAVLRKLGVRSRSHVRERLKE